MRYFLVLLFLTVYCSCKKDQIDYSQRINLLQNNFSPKIAGTSVTVMTYNLQCGFPIGHDPWNINDTGGSIEHIDSLAQFINSTGADIIALQEVPLGRSNNKVKAFLDSLAKCLGMNYAYTSHGYNDAYNPDFPLTGQWGVAILTRYGIESMDSREVSYESIWTRRSTIRARLRLDASREIDVFSLHHEPRQDASDLMKSAEFVHESTLPSIVCGDFNTGVSYPTQYLQMQESLPDSIRGIDMIFHGPSFQVLEAHTAYQVDLSDHPPYWAKLSF